MHYHGPAFSPDMLIVITLLANDMLIFQLFFLTLMRMDGWYSNHICYIINIIILFIIHLFDWVKVVAAVGNLRVEQLCQLACDL